MTLKELNEYIAESPNYEWYQAYKFDIKYPHLNFDVTLQSVSAIYQFCLKQVNGFDQIQHLPQEIMSSKTAFSDVAKRIVRLLTENNVHLNTWNDNISLITRTNPLMFLYDSAETSFLIRLKEENNNYYNGAYEYFTGVVNNVSSKPYLIGYLKAYEFTTKGNSHIVERKETEKRSISRLRSEFEKLLGDSEKEMTSYLSQVNDKYEKYSDKIDLYRGKIEEEYSEWYNKIVTDFNAFTSNSESVIKSLETLYQEKLKLEAPAKYWNERATKLRKEGYWWLGGLILSVAIGIVILIWVLNKVADGTFQDIFKETGSAVKWSVALITLISFLAYIIRILSKLTFSSFHLVRDAEEREQLTYVYLALQKEKSIDQTERHLVMQSLFSRADSGLLKEDASPTMPGNIIDQMTKK